MSADNQTTESYVDDEVVAKQLNLDVAIIHNIIKHAYNYFCEFSEDSDVRPIDPKDLARTTIIACARRWLERGGKDEITYEQGQANQRDAIIKLSQWNGAQE